MKAKFTYAGIRVTELERSIEFYTKLLGMKVQGRGKIPQTKGETVGLWSEDEGFLLELNYYEADSPYYTKYSSGEALDHLGFKVENLDKALEEVRSMGYETLADITSDGGRWAYIEDPNGIWIELN
jgi:lactoylglutathione lyase